MLDDDVDPLTAAQQMLRMLVMNDLRSKNGGGGTYGVLQLPGDNRPACFVSFNNTLYFRTKWSDEEIADALSVAYQNMQSKTYISYKSLTMIQHFS